MKKYWKIAAAAVFLTAAGVVFWLTGGTGVSIERLEEGILMEGELPEGGNGEVSEMESGLEDFSGDDGAAGETAAAGGKNGGLSGADGISEDERAAEDVPDAGGMTEKGSKAVSKTQTGTGGSSGTSGLSGSENAAGEPAGTGSEAPSLMVHVCGEVLSPGVYEFPEGSRIYEAVEAAGGFTEEAAPEAVNLAALLQDGTQIRIYSKEEAQTLPAGGAAWSGNGAGSRSSEGTSGLVNLNTATREELMTLFGIGESRAEDIIRYREENGGFQKIEDIMKVPGIKEAGFQKIKDRITV